MDDHLSYAVGNTLGKALIFKKHESLFVSFNVHMCCILIGLQDTMGNEFEDYKDN